MSLSLLVGFWVALCIGLLIIWTQRLHGSITSDSGAGAQKIHSGEVPRVGGVAVGAGILINGSVLSFNTPHLWMAFVVCALPAFISGLMEDLTKRVSVRTRLLSTILSGMTFSALTGYSLNHLGIEGVDWLLSIPIISLLFTALAIGGVANAMNIIDGCNGLASGTAIILFAVFAIVSWQVGDLDLAMVSVMFLVSVAGFFVLNFPHGLIFLGDAGAYTIGFLLAALAVALPSRNPELSPVIGLSVLVYPVTETLFSIIRRVREEKAKVGHPDRKHLHSLVFRALRKSVGDSKQRNYRSSVFVLGLPLSSAVLTILLARADTLTMLILVALNVVFYGAAYQIALKRVRSLRRSQLKDDRRMRNQRVA